jgi:hypothetical protein
MDHRQSPGVVGVGVGEKDRFNTAKVTDAGQVWQEVVGLAYSQPGIYEQAMAADLKQGTTSADFFGTTEGD